MFLFSYTIHLIFNLEYLFIGLILFKTIIAIINVEIKYIIVYGPKFKKKLIFTIQNKIKNICFNIYE